MIALIGFITEITINVNKEGRYIKNGTENYFQIVFLRAIEMV